MDESEPDVNRKAATWVTAAVLASSCRPHSDETIEQQPIRLSYGGVCIKSRAWLSGLRGLRVAGSCTGRSRTVRHAVTFPKGQLRPPKGFWSLTLYNAHHFFTPNGQKRYSLGTKTRTLKYNGGGSLTIYMQSMYARRR